jgi:hypothetical protein
MTCNHRQNTSDIACDLQLSRKNENYFKKGRDVSMSLVVFEWKIAEHF